jgi:hypothetical protein
VVWRGSPIGRDLIFNVNRFYALYHPACDRAPKLFLGFEII